MTTYKDTTYTWDTGDLLFRMFQRANGLYIEQIIPFIPTGIKFMQYTGVILKDVVKGLFNRAYISRPHISQDPDSSI